MYDGSSRGQPHLLLLGFRNPLMWLILIFDSLLCKCICIQDILVTAFIICSWHTFSCYLKSCHTACCKKIDLCCHLDQRDCIVFQFAVNPYPPNKEGVMHHSSTPMNFVRAARSTCSSLAAGTHTRTELSPERPMVQLNYVTPMLRAPVGSRNDCRHCLSQVWWSIRMHTMQHTAASVMHMVSHGCMTLHKDVCRYYWVYVCI